MRMLVAAALGTLCVALPAAAQNVMVPVQSQSVNLWDRAGNEPTPASLNANPSYAADLEQAKTGGSLRQERWARQRAAKLAARKAAESARSE